MNLAILICRNVTKICTSSGCLKAFNNRSGSFEQYGVEPLTLCAYTTCLGCEDLQSSDSSNFADRLASLKKIGVEKIHLGICTSDKYCKNSDKLIGEIKKFGFEVEMGTHK